jgi:hypothetical protein
MEEPVGRLVSPPPGAMASLRTPLTEGEQQVLKWFQQRLSDKWEIYVQPHLNGLRPDFVLVNPAVGIAVFEVKDWSPGTLKIALEHRRGLAQADPVAQVIGYKSEILNLYCPRLGVRAADNPKSLAVVTAGVIMTRIPTAEVRQLLLPVLRERGLDDAALPYHPVAGSDALATGNIPIIFPDAGRQRSYWMEERFADDLRSWLVEPDFAAAQRNPLPLNPQQRQLATTRTESGYRRIKGPAGSGKSLVLAARAAQLSAEGKDVLVVTFNITLLHYLRDLAVRYPHPKRSITQRITWLHFHEWCKRVCYEAGHGAAYREFWRSHFAGRDPYEVDNSADQALEVGLPSLVAELLGNRPPNGVTQYDAVLVDEGQDFNPYWWNLLRKVRRPDGEMVLVADETQDLYGRARNWTDESMRGAGFAGDWSRLRDSYRLPPELVPHLRRYLDDFFSGLEVNIPQPAQLELPLAPVHLRWLQLEPGMDTSAACVQAAMDAPGVSDPERVAMADVTLLVDSNKVGLQCVDIFKQRGVRVSHVFGEDQRQRRAQKLAFYMGDARVKAATVHSFKGWESRALVVQIRSATNLGDRAAVYVGLSRLKRSEDGSGSYLTVVCSAPELEQYGRTWPEFRQVRQRVEAIRPPRTASPIKRWSAL